MVSRQNIRFPHAPTCCQTQYPTTSLTSVKAGSKSCGGVVSRLPAASASSSVSASWHLGTGPAAFAATCRYGNTGTCGQQVGGNSVHAASCRCSLHAHDVADIIPAGGCKGCRTAHLTQRTQGRKPPAPARLSSATVCGAGLCCQQLEPGVAWQQWRSWWGCRLRHDSLEQIRPAAVCLWLHLAAVNLQQFKYQAL